MIHGRRNPWLWRGFGIALLILAQLVTTYLSSAQGLPDLRSQASQMSLSRQFTIHGGHEGSGGLMEMSVPRGRGGKELALWLAKVPGTAPGAKIDIDPRLATVSCERIKLAVLKILNQPDRWRGRIHVYLVNPLKWKGATEIRPVSYSDGWQYAVIIPEQVDWQVFVRTIVGTVLLELANRSDPDHFGDPPLWLTEGLSALIIMNPGRSLVLEQGKTFQTDLLRPRVTDEARSLLGRQEALDFTTLGDTDVSKLADEVDLARFRGSALLFTHELLERPGGQNSLSRFIGSLSGVLNWQTAFMRAYQSEFASFLDVEKWWAVSDASTMSLDPVNLWPRETILAHLSEIFVETADARWSTNGVATRQVVSLTEMVIQWDFESQKDVLARKISQLRILHNHSPKDMLPIVDEIYRTLIEYKDDRTNVGRDPEGRGRFEGRAQFVAQTAVKHIADLARRVDLLRTGKAG
jgi:hypothetical protein